MPSLETVNAAVIRPNSSGDIESLGSVTIGEQDVTIVALQRLGRSSTGYRHTVRGNEGKECIMTKVLIADDSIAVRKVAERLLTEAGFGVTLVANGEEALAYLAKETPDLVVSDVIMPDKSGYEVCAFIRAQRTLANTPVLLISGIVNDEVTKQAEVCHADGVLKKPFQGTSLKDRVLELLAKRQSAAAPVVKSAKR